MHLRRLASQRTLALSAPCRRVVKHRRWLTTTETDKPFGGGSSAGGIGATPPLGKPGEKVNVIFPPPPPPPPPPTPSNTGPVLAGALVLTAALLYYFRDDVVRLTKPGGPAPAAPNKPPPTPSTATPKAGDVRSSDKATGADAAGKLYDDKLNPKNVDKPKLDIKPVEVSTAAFAGSDPKKPPPADVVASKQQAETKLETAADKVDWTRLRARIEGMLDDDTWDDGSWGPVFVRLAWHAAGTWDKNLRVGGPDGARMRFAPESMWAGNAGLEHARARLEPLKKEFPDISYADLWSYAGTVAIAAMGGPEIKWRAGRTDVAVPKLRLNEELLPDASGRDKKSHIADHLRDIFYRMGFNDREIVALSGGHALGRCHEDRSGYWGPWTRAPTTFSNEFYRLLLEEKWTPKTTHKGGQWKGPLQYEDRTGELMMLPTDIALVQDAKMKAVVQEYAKDEKKFFDDFSKAWIKLQENGVPAFEKPWYQFW